jgi:hypothetical protein
LDPETERIGALTALSGFGHPSALANHDLLCPQHE